jgi:hypothetical protein
MQAWRGSAAPAEEQLFQVCTCSSACTCSHLQSWAYKVAVMQTPAHDCQNMLVRTTGLLLLLCTWCCHIPGRQIGRINPGAIWRRLQRIQISPSANGSANMWHNNSPSSGEVAHRRPVCNDTIHDEAVCMHV